MFFIGRGSAWGGDVELGCLDGAAVADDCRAIADPIREYCPSARSGPAFSHCRKIGQSSNGFTIIQQANKCAEQWVSHCKALRSVNRVQYPAIASTRSAVIFFPDNAMVRISIKY